MGGGGSSRHCISLYFSAAGPDLFHINSRPKLIKYLTKQLLYNDLAKKNTFYITAAFVNSINLQKPKA